MVAPIVGTLKKKIITDITVSFVVGGALAAGWWYGIHNGYVKQRENWYAEYEKTKGQDD